MEIIKQYTAIAIEEICKPKFASTKQLLAVCELEFENGLPKIARINQKYTDQKAAVYFVVKNESYFIEVHLVTKPTIEIDFVYAQSGHRVYLTATSKILNFEELAKFINLKPQTGWSKGDLHKKSNHRYTFSRLNYEPIKNEAYGLDEKLNLLLDELEKDITDVKNLAANANAYISVCKHQYISGNAGIGFDIETINRLHKLNIGIDIDTYIVGEVVEE